MDHRVSQRRNKDSIKAENQPAQLYGISLAYNLQRVPKKENIHTFYERKKTIKILIVYIDNKR